MNIYTNHPNFEAFVKNEVETLNYLTSRDCTKDYTELTTSISIANAEYTSKLKKGKLNHFNLFRMRNQILQISIMLNFLNQEVNCLDTFWTCALSVCLSYTSPQATLGVPLCPFWILGPLESLRLCPQGLCMVCSTQIHLFHIHVLLTYQPHLVHMLASIYSSISTHVFLTLNLSSFLSSLAF